MITRRQVLALVTLVAIGATLEPAGQGCTDTDDTEPEPEPP